MRLNRTAALALLPALLLAACGEDPAPADETGDTGAAAGEVLGGSISDEMLPLGELESQSPPLREATSSSGSSSSAGQAAASEPVESAPPAEASEAAEQGTADESAAAEGED